MKTLINYLYNSKYIIYYFGVEQQKQKMTYENNNFKTCKRRKNKQHENKTINSSVGFSAADLILLMVDIMVLLILVWTIKHFGF